MIRTSFDMSEASRTYWLAHPGGEDCECVEEGAEAFSVFQKDDACGNPVLRYVVCERCHEVAARKYAKELNTQEPS